MTLRIRSLCILFLLSAWFPTAWAAPVPGRTAEEVKSSLERIRRQAEENRRRLRRTEARERSVVAQLDSLDREAGAARAYVKQLDIEAERLTHEMRGADSSVRTLTGRLTAQQEGLAGRLRDIYKRSHRLQGLGATLTSDSFAEIVRHSRYLAAVARQDRQDCERILSDRDAVAAGRSRLAAQMEAFEAVRREKAAQVDVLNTQTRTRRLLLAEVRKNVNSFRAAEGQLARERDRSESALRRLIAGAEETRVRKGEGSDLAPGSFPGFRGRLRWPVRGPIVGRFGRVQDPTLGTWTFNRGIEIGAAEGVPVESVAAGRVETVDWFRGYGWFALIGHGDGYYTLYAHLSEVNARVGEQVRAGEVIGLSGNTGTLDQRPRLHFEVLRGGEPEDPAAWLGR